LAQGSPVFRACSEKPWLQLGLCASDRCIQAWHWSCVNTSWWFQWGAPNCVLYRKLLPREEKYYTVEKQFLPIKLGVNAFRVYLLGRSFQIEMDYCCLEWLDRMKGDNTRCTNGACLYSPITLLSAIELVCLTPMQAPCLGPQ